MDSEERQGNPPLGRGQGSDKELSGTTETDTPLAATPVTGGLGINLKLGHQGSFGINYSFPDNFYVVLRTLWGVCVLI